MNDLCLVCNSPQNPDQTSSCPTCKSNKYFRKFGIDTEQVCKSCTRKTRVYSNQECWDCLSSAGLKECNRCKEIKPLHLSFDIKKAVCKQCCRPYGHLSKQERAKNTYYLKTYNLTFEEVQVMSRAQGNACKICHKKAALAVDHDHRTGAVRGLLCMSCNTGLGHLYDSVDNLLAALEYLRADPMAIPKPAPAPITAPAPKSGDQFVTILEIEAENAALRKELEHLRGNLVGRDVFLAMASALRREVANKQEGKSRTAALAWIDNMVTQKNR